MNLAKRFGKLTYDQAVYIEYSQNGTITSEKGRDLTQSYDKNP